MTTLVQQAMDTLTVRCNPAHLHPHDEDTIKSFLKALHKHGESINPSELKVMAEASNWGKEPVKQLMKWAEAISSGGRVVIKDKRMVETEKQIIAHLKKRMEENSISA